MNKYLHIYIYYVYISIWDPVHKWLFEAIFFFSACARRCCSSSESISVSVEPPKVPKRDQPNATTWFPRILLDNGVKINHKNQPNVGIYTIHGWCGILLFGCFQKLWVPPNHPLKNRVFHDFHHPFWRFSTYFWKHPKKEHTKGPKINDITEVSTKFCPLNGLTNATWPVDVSG